VASSWSRQGAVSKLIAGTTESPTNYLKRGEKARAPVLRRRLQGPWRDDEWGTWSSVTVPQKKILGKKRRQWWTNYVRARRRAHRRTLARGKRKTISPPGFEGAYNDSSKERRIFGSKKGKSRPVNLRRATRKPGAAGQRKKRGPRTEKHFGEVSLTGKPRKVPNKL